MIDLSRLRRCYRTVRDHLLDQRTDAGHWVGELSTSALSTATAVMALEMVRRHRARGQESGVRGQESGVRGQGAAVSRPFTTHHSPLTPLIDGGLAWLAEHQNDDGGWGDTTKSLSNISTTMLARAVFRATGTETQYASVVSQAEQYIERIGGVPAVVARYGKDRTFSVPILTHCALAGMADWRTIPALPFELACLPARFYKTVRLPVVSYALPALIAIGQVRHHFAPTRNPITRVLRNAAKKSSLKVLERIQPTSGGFLEATPLTSFVTMSLAGMGLAGHPVAQKGLAFIIDSVREDGSWPIDTNLATWVTTLAVNALGDDLPDDARAPIRDWLLAQQYKEVHPYTNADPGGWAWTNLPGGVPDADDTPGAILALLHLASGGRKRPGYSVLSTQYSVPISLTPEEYTSEEYNASFATSVPWLLDLQNRDGGWPTFCRGWGALPFDRSAPDISAHAIRALHEWMQAILATIESPSLDDIERNSQSCLDRFHIRTAGVILKGFRFLKKAQQSDGAWFPLWFGNQHHPDEANPTYGTARVLAAYREAGWLVAEPTGNSKRSRRIPYGQQDTAWLRSEPARRGVQWLVANQNADGGWGGAKGIRSSVEETALATEILLSVPEARAAAVRGVEWLLDRVEDGSYTEPTPIGFYFAKLWYFESLYPQIFMTAALRRAVETLTPTATDESPRISIRG